MLNLFSLKEKKEAEVKSGGWGKKKTSAAQLRITKVTNLPLSSLLTPLYPQDINEMELPKTCKTDFPDPDDLLVFKLTIYPDEVHSRVDITALFVRVMYFQGVYRDGQFTFSFKIGPSYPHEPPKVGALGPYLTSISPRVR